MLCGANLYAEWHFAECCGVLLSKWGREGGGASSRCLPLNPNPKREKHLTMRLLFQGILKGEVSLYY